MKNLQKEYASLQKELAHSIACQRADSVQRIASQRADYVQRIASLESELAKQREEIQSQSAAKLPEEPVMHTESPTGLEQPTEGKKQNGKGEKPKEK